jgi:drug/metabolite transporter (DMT)-like permease
LGAGGILDVHTLNGVRFGSAAALVFLPYVLFRNHSTPGVVDRGVLTRALVPALTCTIGTFLQMESFYLISPTVSSFCSTSTLVAGALGGAFFFADDRALVRTPLFCLGSVALLAGSVAMSVLGHERGDDAGSGGTGRSARVLGVACAVAAGIVLGLYSVAARLFLTGHTRFTRGGRGPIQPALAAAVVCAESGVMFVALMFWKADDPLGQLTAMDKQACLRLLLSMTGIVPGHPALFAAATMVGVAVASGIVQLQPVTVGLWAMAFQGARFSSAQLLCAAIAVAAMLAIVVAKARVDAAASADADVAADRKPLTMGEMTDAELEEGLLAQGSQAVE